MDARLTVGCGAVIYGICWLLAASQNPGRRNAKMKKNTFSPKSIIAILIAAIIALTAFMPVSAYGGRIYVADETDSIPAEELAELNEYAGTCIGNLRNGYFVPAGGG